MHSITKKAQLNRHYDVVLLFDRPNRIPNIREERSKY